jgi:uncharacterized membrane protein YhaH (DUF805 family)
MSFRLLMTGFEGRIGRARWWLGQVIVAGYVAFVTFVGSMLGVPGIDPATPADADHPMTTTGLVFVVLGLISLWPSLAVAAKRWHDRGKSGWWSLILLVPVLGGLWTLIELGLLRGEPQVNRFGAPPGPQGR